MTSMHRRSVPPPLVVGPSSSLPTEHGTFTIRSFTHNGITHAVMSMGSPEKRDAPLVRVHSECLTGDALGSHRCDCGDQLTAALAAIAASGHGLLIYMTQHEGRGIGLAAKLQAYALQDGGLDTVSANRALGLPDDARDYDAAAAVLRELGCPRIRLLSSNPSKQEALEALGIEVASRVRLPVADRPENSRYLMSKRLRMNHDVPSHLEEELTAVPSTRQARHEPPVSSHLPLNGRDVYDTLSDEAEVVAQLAQSQDGFIATSTGDACFVSGRTDRTHLHRVRASVGAVLVGAQTVIADDPQLTVRAVEGENPVRVVLDPRGRVPTESTVLRTGPAATLWMIGAEATVGSDVGDHVRVVRLPPMGAGETAAPQTVIALIREHVPGSILVEGGGRTVSRFLSAGVLDRLFLTTAPVFIGDGVPGIRFEGSEVMAQALRTPFRRFELGEDICTEYLLSPAAVEHSSQAPVPNSVTVGSTPSTG
ncbi:GTP cyclohydrolase II RibA [Brevibacterium renqingii]|uniref:GTP cyclohydrolase II RibA n=1 Tax=Brevibacterium renqingii TaxID=2776916 RepID=UPI001ADF0DF0|nr:GTP cyclohydrolase II RibA [Brevibacterium renqingii]